jgi:phage repressor protein C with HTH and peptisase S24 domain
MDTIERLNELIEAKCGERGATAFSKLIGIHQVTLNNYILGKRKLSLEVIEAVLNTFPDVSAEWLLRGQDMPKDEEKHLDVPVKTLPRIPVKASAGSLTTMVDGITEIQCEQFPVVHNFPKYDFTIHISGDSMVPYYISGDEVACLRITSATFIQWGRVHVLDTSQGIVIKRIYDNGDTIRCVSYNPDYPDFNVPKDEIFSYNLVVGTLRL